MACSNPIIIHNKKYNEDFVVPCNWCLSCRIDRRNAWEDRITSEMKGKPATFLTLTYDDEHLPAGDTLVKRDLQLFFKRLRRHLEYVDKKHNRPVRKIKYFACGEYGSSVKVQNIALGRAHYHAILIGINPLDSGWFVEKIWQKGSTRSLPCQKGSVRYVLKYMDKQMSPSMSEAFYGDRQPPFLLCSQGIGKQYLIDNIDFVKEYGSYRSKGILRPIPKYYKDLLRLRGDPEKSKRMWLESAVKAGYPPQDVEIYKRRVLNQKEMHYVKEARMHDTPMETPFLIGSIKREFHAQENTFKIAEEAIVED